MKRSFVRALWGNCCFDPSDIKKTILQDIENIQNNQYNEPFVVYAMGKKNYEFISNKGFNCILMDTLPVRYDMAKYLWRHKLDVLKRAMEDFDEIVFMDWDCKPTKKIPVDFWEIMRKKAPFQANLMQYRTKRCLWRRNDCRKTCNGGFVYIRDKNIPDCFIANHNLFIDWAESQKIKRARRGLDLRFREKALIYDDEPSMSKFVDDYYGDWPGLDKYWELFEPEFCNIRKSAYDRELLKTKNECFIHWV